MSRLKSRLKSTNTILNSSKSTYNVVNDSTNTGQTIPNTLKSSVDIILYDDVSADVSVDNTTNTDPTLSAKNETLNVIDDNMTDTLNSSIGFDEDDTFFDDDDHIIHTDVTITAHDDNTVECKCCSWLNKYKKSITMSIVLCIINVLIQLGTERETISRSIATVYTEFILYIITLCIIFRLFWGLLSYALFICTAKHWYKCSNVRTLIFYIHHSGFYLKYSLLSTFCYVMFEYQQSNPEEIWRVNAIIDNADPKVIEIIERIFLCAMVLFYGLFIKTMLIRWVCLEYYLSSHLVKIKKLKKYESWLKVLLKKSRIFSMKVKQFLDLNELHNKHQDSDLCRLQKTVAFRLDVLALQEEFNLNNGGRIMSNNMDKIKEDNDSDVDSDDRTYDSLHSSLHDTINNQLVNTLKSGDFYGLQRKYDHNIQTCLLWLYNAKTGKVTVIDDNELDKVCKQFAKFIVLSVTKKRLDAKTPKSNHQQTEKRPTFRELKNMFARNSVPITDDAGENVERNDRANTFRTAPRLKRSSMTVGGQFITQSEFIRCFTKLNKTRQGYDAWKDINVSEKFLSKNELQRWLYQYLHDLIYLKQTLNSYQEILSNLDMSSNLITVFILLFVFLLIFQFNFIDSVSIYFSLIAIFAVFGKNVFTHFFDALYFVFLLSPFEIGDVVLIDDIRYKINKIHIMSTEMVTAVADGNTHVLKSNALLLGKDIKNLSRTKSPYHNLTFYISQNTSIDELNILKLKIDSFIRSKMKNDINDIWFILDGVDKECRMKIRLFLGSIYSFSDSGLMWKQHHIINMQIRNFINEMGIQYKRFSNQDVELTALIQEQEIRERKQNKRKSKYV